MNKNRKKKIITQVKKNRKARRDIEQELDTPRERHKIHKTHKKDKKRQNTLRNWDYEKDHD